MQNWEFFYFLWDDPLFSDGRWGGSDPESRDLRRQAVLLTLESLYIKIETLQKQAALVERAKEALAKEIWTWLQLWPYVDLDTMKRIHIERKVNELDPDFSFQTAVDSWVPPPK